MQAMLPAQAKNVAEAGLRELPPTDEFLRRLAQSLQPEAAPADTALFGDTYAKPPKRAAGTQRMYQFSVKCALEFEQLCVQKGCEFKNLDDWMVAFAKWTLSSKISVGVGGNRYCGDAARNVCCASWNNRPFLDAPDSVICGEWFGACIQTDTTTIGYCSQCRATISKVLPDF